MIKAAQRLLLPLGMGLSLWFLVVSLAMVGAPTKAQSPPVTGAAINRPQDPVIVTGANLSAHGGAPVNELVLYAYQAGAWTPIPFQFDERSNDITGTYVISDDGLLVRKIEPADTPNACLAKLADGPLDNGGEWVRHTGSAGG